METAKISGYTDSSILEVGLPTVPRQDYQKLPVLNVPRVSFIDVNVGYTSNQDDLLVTNTLAIRQKIRNVLATPVGSEYFEPTYGSLLPYRLMDPINSTTAWLLKTDTAMAIQQWLGRLIRVDMSRVVVAPIYGSPDSEGYEIVVPYSILETSEADSYQFKVLR